MRTIGQLLRIKGNDAYTVSPSETVYQAIKRMAEYDVGSLLVMNGHTLVGLVTERHYARDVVLKGKASPHTLVREIMQTSVVCVTSEQTINECMDLMTLHRVRHLPVVENGNVIGIVSIGDIVKSIIDDQNFTIRQLEGYICGDRLPH